MPRCRTYDGYHWDNLQVGIDPPNQCMRKVCILIFVATTLLIVTTVAISGTLGNWSIWNVNLYLCIFIFMCYINALLGIFGCSAIIIFINSVAVIVFCIFNICHVFIKPNEENVTNGTETILSSIERAVRL